MFYYMIWCCPPLEDPYRIYIETEKEVSDMKALEIARETGDFLCAEDKDCLDSGVYRISADEFPDSEIKNRQVLINMPDDWMLRLRNATEKPLNDMDDVADLIWNLLEKTY